MAVNAHRGDGRLIVHIELHVTVGLDVAGELPPDDGRVLSTAFTCSQCQATWPPGRGVNALMATLAAHLREHDMHGLTTDPWRYRLGSS